MGMLEDIIGSFRSRQAVEQETKSVTEYIPIQVESTNLYDSLFKGKDKVEDGLDNETVSACLDLISNQVLSADLNIYKNVKNDDVIRRQRIYEHRLEKLLDSPNTKYAGTLLMEATVYYLILLGECYWYISRSELRTSREPVAIYFLDPRRMKRNVINGELVNYLYDVNGDGSKIVEYSVDSILPFIKFNPSDPSKGLSRLHAGYKSVTLDKELVNWQLNTMNNRMGSNLIFIKKSNTKGDFSGIGGAKLNGGKVEDIKSRLKQHFGGAKNAREPIILEDLEPFEVNGSNATDLDFLESRKYCNDRLAITMGVPPELVGSTNKTYNNFETAKQVLWEHTVIPILKSIVNTINHGLTPLFKDKNNIFVDCDLTETPFGKYLQLKENEADEKMYKALANKAQAILLYTKAGFTKEEAIKMVDRDVEEYY